MSNHDDLVTKEEMAAILHYKSTKSFMRAVKEKGIPYIKGAVALFNPSEVLLFLKERDNSSRVKSDKPKKEANKCHLKNEVSIITPSSPHQTGSEYARALGLQTG